ncbi:MAG: hypothetical protein GXY50_02860 [Syntrophomonadaceae bacterium]|nr:hypothetical protein [Syntrophomonadaceae bacterium]
MNRKLLLSLLAIGLIAALIGGATMAWFTDEEAVAPATFTAGTVVVDVDGPEIGTPDGKFFDNVNPGDCANVEWNVVNKGTKDAYLRVKLAGSWTDENLLNNNVFWAPDPTSGWKVFEDAEGAVWLVYPQIVAGTYDNEPGEFVSVKLPVIIGFDGDLTGNVYQGKTYILGGEGSEVQAIQASNDAALASWGEEWSEILGNPDYTDAYLDAVDYFTNPERGGYKMPCYDRGDPVEEPGETTLYDVIANVIVAGGGSVVGDDTNIAPNTLVTLTATANEGFDFKGWTLPAGLVLTDGNEESSTIGFVMPANDVNVTANFAATPAPVKYNLDASAWKYYKVNYWEYTWVKSTDYGTVAPTSGSYDKDTSVKLTASPKHGKKVKQWDEYKNGDWKKISNSDGKTSINVTMNADKTIRVVFCDCN